MNIFYVHDNPEIAARSLCDKHVVKMVLESAQLLCTAHRVLDGVEEIALSKSGRKQKVWKLIDSNMNQALYKAAHINHPSAVWVREATMNYAWLYTHYLYLMNEYTQRYYKEHKCGMLRQYLSNHPINIRMNNMYSTPIPLCMPDDVKVIGDPVQSYRNYYNVHKKDMCTWKRNKPSWFVG